MSPDGRSEKRKLAAERLGAWLREIREQAGLRQEDLGAILNPPVGESQISEWEHGHAQPGGVRVVQIMRACSTAMGPAGFTMLEQLLQNYPFDADD